MYYSHAIFFLHNTVHPNITEPPENATVIELGTATFSCQASGLPIPNITWWRTSDSGDAVRIFPDNETVVESMRKYMIVETIMPDERILQSVLTVFNAIPADSGIYICAASNPSLVPDQAQAFLTVLGT